MLYSCGTLAVFRYAKEILQLRTTTLLPRKIETSDPTELNEKHLLVELILERRQKRVDLDVLAEAVRSRLPIS